jgi:hypothetical protein
MVSERASQRTFLGVSALLFAASAPDDRHGLPGTSVHFLDLPTLFSVYPTISSTRRALLLFSVTLVV